MYCTERISCVPLFMAPTQMRIAFYAFLRIYDAARNVIFSFTPSNLLDYANKIACLADKLIRYQEKGGVI